MRYPSVKSPTQLDPNPQWTDTLAEAAPASLARATIPGHSSS